MDLICPKCQAPMRTYERNGVHVDQCTECRGIFLDRGELERLVDAEKSWQASQAPVGEAPEQVRDRHREGHGGGYYGTPRKKKKSFLDEIFG